MAGTRPFDILPAIDLRGGRVVRLRQGDFEQETTYSDDPAAVARGFAAAGARWIHVVDLDGARSGRPVQGDSIRAILESVGEGTRIEVAGGLRSAPAIADAFTAGAARVVVGTVALDDPALVGSLVAAYGPDRIAVAIDVRDGRAMGHGWTTAATGAAGAGGLDAAGLDATEAVEALARVGVTMFEVTAIERDGLLEGPDLVLYDRLVQLNRGSIIASGGITTMEDLQAVRDRGCAGAILGRALYEGHLDLASAIRLTEPGQAG